MKATYSAGGAKNALTTQSRDKQYTECIEEGGPAQITRTTGERKKRQWNGNKNARMG